MDEHDYRNLLERLRIAANKHLTFMFQNEPMPDWGSERDLRFMFGPVWGFYQEKDYQMMRLIHEFDSLDDLKTEVMKSLRIELQQLNSEDTDCMVEGKKKMHCMQICELSELSFADWIHKHANWAQQYPVYVHDQDLLGFLYIHFRYQNWTADIDSPYSSELNNIYSLYEARFSKRSQLHKYGLVPIDAERKVMLIKPPRVYDQSIDKTLWTKNVPFELLEKLYDLKKNGLIGALSIRVKDSYLAGCAKREVVQEELERGRPFSLSDIGTIETTKLYSKKYGDQLWVIADGTDIVFEELCEKFVVHNESIVTQMVHLQFSTEQSESYITHIDHEYIFYSLDEFEKRTMNEHQKGSNQLRLKSFKVDNAHIPFSLNYYVTWKDKKGKQLPEVSVPFICYVLNCYFKHTDLLREYFLGV